MLFKIALYFALVSTALCCADHLNYQDHPHRGKRQTSTDPGRTPTDWSYDASWRWADISPDYALCHTGTQQAPIKLGLTQGLCHTHTLSFNGYTRDVTGNYFNWGYGPAFTLHRPDGTPTSLPSANFDNETVYLTGWHIHAPADHSVADVRAKAEMHFVHIDAAGNYRAVVAFRIDPGQGNSTFVNSFPGYMKPTDTTQIQGITLDHVQALEEVNSVNEYWTYKGSLTSPPCTEGIQWFMASSTMYVSQAQMQEILGSTSFSTRQEQEIWMHEVNM